MAVHSQGFTQSEALTNHNKRSQFSATALLSVIFL